jgi:hypothetical protein
MTVLRSMLNNDNDVRFFILDRDNINTIVVAGVTDNL